MNYFYAILIVFGYLICVDGNAINPFIIDGMVSPVDYVRRIRSIRNQESTQASLFSGFFISDSHMLTAAQALNNFHRFEIVEIVEDGDNFMIPALRAVVHQDFDSLTLKNNIGMLFFPPNTFTGLIPSLPKRETLIDSMVFANGFGVVDNQGGLSDILARALIIIVSLEQCQEIFGDIIATENNFCGWCPSGALCNRVCSGDQGGPVINISNNGLIGIISFWKNCQDSQTPQGFTILSKYLDWIEEQRQTI